MCLLKLQRGVLVVECGSLCRGAPSQPLPLAPRPSPAHPTPTFILRISAFMARISVWPVSESTEARISLANWIFFSQSMIWYL